MIRKNRIHATFLSSLAASMISLYQSNVAANQPNHKAELLFFQHADSGAIIQNSSGADCYQIQLSHLKDQVIYLSHEPVRTTGVMDWSNFVLTWTHNNIHPNAVIHAWKNKTPVNDTVTLYHLHYDKMNKTASYKACSLNPKSTITTGQLTDVSMFLDPFHPWP